MITPTRRPLRRRAFATAMAVTLLGLIGVTLAALAVLLVSDVRRTRDAEAAAQLRQLLLAGEAAAADRLAAGTVTQGENKIPLPPEVAAGGATLALDVTGSTADVAEITVRAAVGQRVAAQSLRYTHGPDGWTLQSTFTDAP